MNSKRFESRQDEETEIVEGLDHPTEPCRSHEDLLSEGDLRAKYRYRRICTLGEGAFGSVYLANCLNRNIEDPDCPPTTVAIKILPVNPGDGSINLFRREVSALLALKNERIPPIFDWHLSSDEVFLVMKYYASGSLQDQIRKGYRADHAAARQLLCDLLHALVAAHNASIVHLDIKPPNVLLDRFGRYVLSDFGVSLGSFLNHKDMPVGLGTAGFQAPEQRLHKTEEIDLRTDLWGVGATVWAAYTGINLFKHPEYIGADQAQELGLPKVENCRDDADSRLVEIIHSLIKTRTHDRPGSASEVLMRVDELFARKSASSISEIIGRRGQFSAEEIRSLHQSLVDPLWRTIFSEKKLENYVCKFDKGWRLGIEGDRAPFAFVLLRGKVRIKSEGQTLAMVDREGAFIGEVATLTGDVRTATMVAEETVWACVFNAVELEHFASNEPAIAVRLIKTLAERLARESSIRREG